MATPGSLVEIASTASSTDGVLLDGNGQPEDSLDNLSGMRYIRDETWKSSYDRCVEVSSWFAMGVNLAEVL
jgi:hypothetical protein